MNDKTITSLKFNFLCYNVVMDYSYTCPNAPDTYLVYYYKVAVSLFHNKKSDMTAALHKSLWAHQLRSDHDHQWKSSLICTYIIMQLGAVYHVCVALWDFTSDMYSSDGTCQWCSSACLCLELNCLTHCPCRWSYIWSTQGGNGPLYFSTVLLHNKITQLHEYNYNPSTCTM